MKKRIIGLVFFIILSFCMLPTLANAEASGDFTYTVSSGKATITDYTGFCYNTSNSVNSRRLPRHVYR